MNVKLLRKVQCAILKNPKRFDMGYWFTNSRAFFLNAKTIKAKKKRFENCGAAACIAGWACLLSKDTTNYNSEYRDHTLVIARKLLDLTRDQANKLFFDGVWDNPFRSNFINASTKAEQAKIASAYIDKFISDYCEEEKYKEILYYECETSKKSTKWDM